MDKPLKPVMHGQCNARPTVTFPVAGHCLSRLVSNYTAWWQRQVCEQLAQGSYLTAAWPGVELATSQVASQRLNHYTTRPLFNASSTLYLHHHLHFNHWCDDKPKLAGSSSTLFLFQVNLSDPVLLRASSSTCSGWKPLGTSDIGFFTGPVLN